MRRYGVQFWSTRHEAYLTRYSFPAATQEQALAKGLAYVKLHIDEIEDPALPRLVRRPGSRNAVVVGYWSKP